MNTRRMIAASLACFVVACGSDESPGGGGSGGSAQGGAGEGATTEGGAPPGGGASEGGSGQGGSSMVTTDFEAGGDRPVTVHVPAGYDPAVPTPVLILLHGYTASGAIQDAYFQMSSAASDKGLIFASPDGMVDATGNQFWNATDSCCNFGNLPVDDSAYLIGLIDEIATKLNVDPARVFFAGHSNGGFMSHRMACDHADRIAAIASLAGATWQDQAECGASEPVSVLQIHGTADATIFYAGGANAGHTYPGAVETVSRWVTVDECDPTSADGAPRDIDQALVGDETLPTIFSGCSNATGVELWTIEGGTHVPSLVPDFSEQVIDWLLAHPK